ncbi:MAG: hypothetical protein N2319_11285 [Candidatus Kapabacteria bacterium]|nr:hypothetical protein [Candidatus Kapabacteria bacterium]
MDSQKAKDILNLSIKIVILCGLVIFITIVAWKLAISDLYFDFTNFTPNDILLIIVSVFFFTAFWLILSKVLYLIEKKSEPTPVNEAIIEKLLSVITEQLNKSQTVQRIADIKDEKDNLNEKINDIYKKLNEIAELIRNINTQPQKEVLKNDLINLNKGHNNNTPEHINSLLKKIISEHFEVSTLKLLPIEIFEFRIKKIINELDLNSINDLIHYEIIDSKKQLTDKGKAKLIELTNSF